MNKQPEITAKTREAFATSFCTLYAQKSIDKITVKEITALAGYNRSTFYQYFDDIYDLLDYVEDSLLTLMKKSWEVESGALFTPDLDLLRAFFADNETFLRAVLGDYGSVHFIARLQEELPLSGLQNAFPAAEHLMPYLIEFHLSTSLALFRVWLRRGKDLPADKLLTLIHACYTGGSAAFLRSCR